MLLFRNDEVSRYKKNVLREAKQAQQEILKSAREKADTCEDRKLKREIMKCARRRVRNNLLDLRHELQFCETIEEIGDVLEQTENQSLFDELDSITDEAQRNFRGPGILKKIMNWVTAISIGILSLPVIAVFMVLGLLAPIIKVLLIPILLPFGIITVRTMFKNNTEY